MLKMLKGISAVFVVCLILSSMAVGVQVEEKQTDAKAIYEEISGTYEFNVDGQIEILIFFIKDGTLLGRSEGDTEEVEIKPVDLETLSFEATDSDGQFYECTFSRDEDKKITKCVIFTQGMELKGTKISGLIF